MFLEHHTHQNKQKFAYSIEEAAKVSGIKRSKIYLEIKAGNLKTRKCGKRTIILASDLQHWLQNLPTS